MFLVGMQDKNLVKIGPRLKSSPTDFHFFAHTFSRLVISIELVRVEMEVTELSGVMMG